MVTVALLGAPTSLGAFAPGQEQAPRALRASGLAERLGAEDLGDLPVRRWRPDRDHRRAQNAAGVIEVARAVAERVEPAVRSGRPALVLGGDCTVELGVVAGVLRAGVEDFGLVYFDMHPDLNTPDGVPSGTLDWMGPAHMLDLPGAHPDVAALGPRRPLLAPEQLSLLGYRPDQTKPGEHDAIASLGIEAIAFDEVLADPAGAAARARARFDRYLVHFDVDVVDFVDLPLSENTGHNIGMPFATARTVLAALAAGDGLLALTVTEHNPAHGAEDGSTSAALADALVDALGD